MGLKSTLYTILGIVIVCILIMAIVLIIMSFEAVDTTEVGLNYDNTKINIENKIYEKGRHFIGVAHDFIIFKKQLQSLTFSKIISRSKDGLKILIDLNFQYKLQISLENMLYLQEIWPWNKYEEGYTDITRNAIADAISEYAAFDLVYNRTSVENSIQDKVEEYLYDYKATIENFQMGDFEYPQLFEEIIQTTQNANLAIQVAEQNKEKIQNTQEGLKKRAEEDAKIIENEAEAKASQITTDAAAKDASLKERVANVKESLAQAQTKLGLAQEKILNYRWIQIASQIQENQGMYIHMKMPQNIKSFFE